MHPEEATNKKEEESEMDDEESIDNGNENQEEDVDDDDKPIPPRPDKPDWQGAVNAVEEGTSFSFRQANPVPEFFTPSILPKCFPDTFMLGRSYGEKVPALGSRQLHHLLLQFTNKPAQDMRLLGYLGDVITKFEVFYGVKAHVRSNPKAQKELSAKLHDDQEIERLNTAIKFWKTKEAEKIMDWYSKHMEFSAHNVSQSMFECSKLKSQVISSTRQQGPGHCMFTIAFNDLDNPRSFRASFSSLDNKSFPAVFEENSPFGSNAEEFIKLLAKSSTEVSYMEHEGPRVDLDGRAVAGINNPVAYVQECKKLMSDVCRILFGLAPEHFFEATSGTSTRKTWCYTCNKGILGYCFTIIGVMEEHAKGTLHFHLIIWAGISPYALQELAGIPELCVAIARVLDTQYRQSLPTMPLLTRLIKERVQFKVKAQSAHGSSLSTILQYPDLSCIIKDAKTNNE
jgi:hypothetical protein